jgi:hypothetical protein
MSTSASDTATSATGVAARRRDIAWFALADAVAILLLVLAGELRHGVDVVANPTRVLVTAAPFLFGWFLVGGLVGAYADRVRAGGLALVRVTAGAWLGGAGVALTLRDSQYLTGSSPLSFALVMTGLGLVALLVARLVVTYGLRRRRQ